MSTKQIPSSNGFIVSEVRTDLVPKAKGYAPTHYISAPSGYRWTPDGIKKDAGISPEVTDKRDRAYIFKSRRSAAISANKFSKMVITAL